MKKDAGRDYHCSDHTSWIVEELGLLLIHTKENRQTWLSSPEAAVWDLLTRNRPRECLFRMLAVIADTDQEKAEMLLESCLDQWLKDGWLTCGNTL
jgi:hypothetical protein